MRHFGKKPKAFSEMFRVERISGKSRNIKDLIERH